MGAEQPMLPLLVDLFKAVLLFVGGLATTWLTQKAMRRNAKAVEKTSELDQALRPIKDANDAWADLVEPMRAELKELRKDRDADYEERKADRQRMKDLEDGQKATNDELQDTKGHLERALELVVHFVKWADDGAPPPPPDVPTWVRAYMLTMINDLHPGEHQAVSDADPTEGH